MSYNIDTFKTKKLENLKIPITSLYKHERSDWYPERVNYDNGTVTFEMMGSEITGIIENDIFLCQSIDCSGEGSGTTMSWILEPAFKDSTGELIASCVWEGGDSINQLVVKEGDVKWKDIEI